MAGKEALLVIDMMNPLRFARADLLLAEMKRMIGPLNDLIARARAAEIPVIYVNDCSGRWVSDRNQLIREAMAGPGAGVIAPILPKRSDYFIIKPKHSGFFATPLHALLHELHTETLILTGVAGNICVLFTANDAYMRGYRLLVPQDCCASNAEEDNEYALRMMRQVLGADTRPQARLELRHGDQPLKGNA